MATTALHPYRVIDLTTDRGWLAGKILADLGADVIKVEPPGGDPGRSRNLFLDRTVRDPEANATWLFQNRGKRSVVLDLDDAADRARLLDLVRGAEIVLESFPPGWLEARGIGPDDLLAVNPRLVVTSVTPFGRTGPYPEAGFDGPDLVVSAMCGLMWLCGDPDRAPVRISVPQMFRHAAAEAAAQSLIALFHANRTGVGQHVDVSAQLAGIRTLMNAQAFHLLEGRELVRMGGLGAYSHARFRMVTPCIDGHLTILPLGGPIGGAMMRYLFDWADREGVADPEVITTDFATVNFAAIDAQGPEIAKRFFDGISDTIGRLFARHTKAEIYEVALERLMLIAPVTTMADLRTDVQLAARGYFTPVDHDGTEIHHAGRWVLPSRTPLADTPRAPHVGEHTADVLAEPSRVPAPVGSETAEDAFSGVRVLDLSWVGVGPMTGGYLASHGATVVKVESSVRPDILRLTPPFVDGQPGLNSSHFCANMNGGKLGLGLDLGRPEAREIVLQLVEWADVVLESFTPKTLRAWGLDYAALSARNPSIVMLSTCMQGQTGPRADYRGFGNLMGSLSGFYHVTGWEDRDPVMVYGAYTDFICQRYCTAALVAALDHRRRTGEGQHLDLAQFEAALQFLGPELLAYEHSGEIAGRHGNRDDDAAPHGVFPCLPRADGRECWVAVAVTTDEQWRSLRSALGDPAWALDPALDTLVGRKAAEDRLDAEITAWTSSLALDDVLARLRPAVPCGPVLDVPDLHTDPQIAARGYWVPLEHTVQGTVPYDGTAAHMSVTPGALRKAGPCLGEDSFTVLVDVLGMDPDDVAMLLADGVVEITG